MIASLRKFLQEDAIIGEAYWIRHADNKTARSYELIKNSYLTAVCRDIDYNGNIDDEYSEDEIGHFNAELFEIEPVMDAFFDKQMKEFINENTEKA